MFWFLQPSQYPAYLMVTDIAGLVKGAAEGAGLGNAFLSNIQAVDGCVASFPCIHLVFVECAARTCLQWPSTADQL